MWPNQLDVTVAELRRIELIAAAGRERTAHDALGDRGIDWAGNLASIAGRAARLMGLL